MTPDELRQWYELEKGLATRIREAPRERRAQVAMESYDTLFRKVPYHPLVDPGSPDAHLNPIALRYYQLAIGPGRDVLEIGCGSGELAVALAPMCGRYLATDASAEIMDIESGALPNLEVAIADAVEFDVPESSFDVALSCQLIEHLHPEDVPLHLRNVCRALRPGGRYLFDTPCGLTGPHDVSRHFDTVATGFHLKEWTHAEMCRELRAAGFRKLRSHILPSRLSSRAGAMFALGLWPAGWKAMLEATLGRVPHKRLRRIAGKLLNFDNLWMIARK